MNLSSDPEKEGDALETNDISKNEGKRRDLTKNSSLLRLAQLSLEDWKWRTSVYKTNEADRLIEQSLARLMGDDASYIRPMDASEKKIGPLVRNNVIFSGPLHFQESFTISTFCPSIRVVSRNRQ